MKRFNTTAVCIPSKKKQGQVPLYWVCNGFTEVLKSVILKSSETHFSDVIDDPAGDETLAMVVHGGYG